VPLELLHHGQRARAQPRVQLGVVRLTDLPHRVIELELLECPQGERFVAFERLLEVRRQRRGRPRPAEEARQGPMECKGDEAGGDDCGREQQERDRVRVPGERDRGDRPPSRAAGRTGRR
jgi:hypothetical protein